VKTARERQRWLKGEPIAYRDVTVPSLTTLFSEDTAVWQRLAPAGTRAQPSEKAELTKTHQVSWPGCHAKLLSLSLYLPCLSSM